MTVLIESSYYYVADSLDNVSTSTIPVMLGSRVADIVARATTWTSNGRIPAAPTSGREPPSMEFIFAIVENTPFTGARCGRSWFENINPNVTFKGSMTGIPGLIKIDRRPSIWDIALSASLSISILLDLYSSPLRGNVSMWHTRKVPGR